MPLNRSEITDADGRHIPVVHRRIEGPPKRAIDAAANAVLPNGPRSLQEFGHLLDSLVGRVNRLSPSHRRPERYFEDRSEIARDLARLAAWATRGSK